MILKLLQIQNQIQIWHWRTDSYAQHKAFGMFYDEFSDKVDEFIECLQGQKGKKFKVESSQFDLKGEVDIVFIQNEWMKSVENFLVDELNKYIETNNALKNIRDELVGLLYKLRYLLTLE